MASRNFNQLSTTYGSDVVLFAGHYTTGANGEVTSVTPASGYTFDVEKVGLNPGEYTVTMRCAFDASWRVDNILFFQGQIVTTQGLFFEWESLPQNNDRTFRFGLVVNGNPVDPTNATISLAFAVKYTTSVR